MDFDQPILRFALSGVLIGLYGVVDRLARVRAGDPLRAAAIRPRWLAALVFASLLAFYATIRPFGGTWLGGVGNVAGIVLALAAMAVRWTTRRGSKRVRQPDVAARMLFYAALPLAVGVASGLLTLTLPAVATSAWWCRREDAHLLRVHGDAWAERMARSAHWLPGVW